MPGQLTSVGSTRIRRLASDGGDPSGCSPRARGPSPRDALRLVPRPRDVLRLAPRSLVWLVMWPGIPTGRDD